MLYKEKQVEFSISLMDLGIVSATLHYLWHTFYLRRYGSMEAKQSLHVANVVSPHLAS